MMNIDGRTVLTTGTGDQDKAEAAKNWLKKMSTKHPSTASELFETGGFYSSSVVWGLKILHIGGGRSLCGFKIPDHLTNEDGNWTAGAIAAMIDIIGASSIVTAVGEMKVSVNFSITYLTPAKSQDQVEIEGKVLFDVGKLTDVLVEIRKKSSGALVAVGRQWMSSTNSNRSKI